MLINIFSFSNIKKPPSRGGVYTADSYIQLDAPCSRSEEDSGSLACRVIAHYSYGIAVESNHVSPDLLRSDP